MSKILIVYYSLSGNTKFIAEELQKATNADVLTLKPIKELNPDSGMKYFCGGFQANMKIKPKLESFDRNPLDYDLIILGTPVWSWTFSPPMRSFMAKFDLTGKKVALWVCCAGNGIKALSRFKNEFSEPNIIGERIFIEPKEKNLEESATRAAEWGKELLGALFGA